MSATRAAIVSACALGALVLLPVPAAGDAQVHEWIGVYAMNHDGHLGRLEIRDSKQDCATSRWCHLVLLYQDRAGRRMRGRIETIDQAFQHMAFVIEFPGNPQRFDAYLMSWDKTKMAGTTDWNGRRFGFFATKEQPVLAERPELVRPGRRERPRFEIPGRAGAADTPPPADAPAAESAAPGRKTVRADGSVETKMPDGSTRVQRPGDCGWTTIQADGTTSRVSCAQTPFGSPPGVPDAATGSWLDRHNDSLLNIVQGLVNGDQRAVDNYVSNVERDATGVYDRIRLRTELIRLLAVP